MDTNTDETRPTMEAPVPEERAHVVSPPSTGGTLTPEQVALIKRTVARDTTDDELALFLHVCRRSGLDPLARHIHAVKRWNAKDQREVMTIQTGIDGYRLIAARTGEHMGTEDAVFDTETEAHPHKATVTVYRLCHGQRVAFTASARWAEYVQTARSGEPNATWQKMPYLMIAKCAEANALRKAFPAELSSVYTHEEMMQAELAPSVGVNEPAPTRALPEGSGGPALSPKGQLPPAPPLRNLVEVSAYITQRDIGRLMATCKQYGITEEVLKDYLAGRGVASRKEILVADLPEIVEWIKANDDLPA